MTQILNIHPENPQKRLIHRAVEAIRAGEVVVYPTDSGYALGCEIGNKNALQKIQRIRQLDSRHNFTLVCRDLSELSRYARVDNSDYRLLKAFTPGPYTFILLATSEVPRLMQHPKRKTIGLRVPDHPIVQSLLAELDGPIMSSTLIFPGEEDPPVDIEAVMPQLHETGLVIDGGFCGVEPTTVVDLTNHVPEILRVGKGDPAPFR